MGAQVPLKAIDVEFENTVTWESSTGAELLGSQITQVVE